MQGHKKACMTPEEIEKRRARNKRKQIKRMLKRKAEKEAKGGDAKECTKKKRIKKDGKNGTFQVVKKAK
jgi:hypothetical protein